MKTHAAIAPVAIMEAKAKAIVVYCIFERGLSVKE